MTESERLLCQVASYNTNLQGSSGLPQDLVDWLSPTLTVSNFLSREPRGPDVVAVGFQELLPLHLAFAGLSRSILDSRTTLIQSQIEKYAPNGERYTLVARAVNVGVALLVFARDDTLGRRICDVQTQWTGCGPLWLGNKGAVGVRFRAKALDGGEGEIYTFVCAHLTPFAHKLSARIADYNYIARSLLFPDPSSNSSEVTTMYATSHLFFLGDLNFRVTLPSDHPLAKPVGPVPSKKIRDSDSHPAVWEALSSHEGRVELKEYDQLTKVRRNGEALVGLREADFWKFQCTYKYKLGEVDAYSSKRTPSWTDRILYTTYTDDPTTPDLSHITPLIYTSIPSYTTSDHKPIVGLYLLPPSPDTRDSIIPLITHPPQYLPDPYWRAKRWTGRFIGWTIGWIWCFFWFIGLGNAGVGFANLFVGIGAWKWWGDKKGTIRLP
ncbi:DNase I-like protein [Sistotremastrum suecicum HHB10207 ss-3]|uniref:DNase I-like protein n=1 Tax=Sistotremastrum suecicum HHB10207 ss-3 TaxID=1314776 RepID=A0A166A7X1_9AGAM|nr:DNase I-like protein [Sistotremastrum suecicum HHB10207 ss-3]